MRCIMRCIRLSLGEDTKYGNAPDGVSRPIKSTKRKREGKLRSCCCWRLPYTRRSSTDLAQESGYQTPTETVSFPATAHPSGRRTRRRKKRSPPGRPLSTTSRGKPRSSLKVSKQLDATRTHRPGTRGTAVNTAGGKIVL